MDEEGSDVVQPARSRSANMGASKSVGIAVIIVDSIGFFWCLILVTAIRANHQDGSYAGSELFLV